MMKRLSRREKVIAALTLGLLFAYGVVNFVVQPLKGTLMNIDDSIQNSEERLAKAREVLNGHRGQKGVMDGVQLALGRASQDSLEFSGLVNMLENEAKSAGVRIINIEPRPVIRDILARFPVSLNISGSSKNIARFLFAIQSQRVSLNVDNVNLERAMEANMVINGSMVVSRLRVTD